jgi:hypothetical protein
MVVPKAHVMVVPTRARTRPRSPTIVEIATRRIGVCNAHRECGQCNKSKDDTLDHDLTDYFTL